MPWFSLLSQPGLGGSEATHPSPLTATHACTDAMYGPPRSHVHRHQDPKPQVGTPEHMAIPMHGPLGIHVHPCPDPGPCAHILHVETMHTCMHGHPELHMHDTEAQAYVHTCTCPHINIHTGYMYTSTQTQTHGQICTCVHTHIYEHLGLHVHRCPDLSPQIHLHSAHTHTFMASQRYLCKNTTVQTTGCLCIHAHTCVLS